MKQKAGSTKIRQCIVGAAFLALSSSLYAQVGEIHNDFAFGVNGGMAFNEMYFSPTIKQSFHPGKTFGVTFRYTCEKYFSSYCSLQTEINYAELGWKELIETSTDTYQRNVNYIQVPFLTRMAWGKEKKGVMGYIVLGPQVAFYLSDKDKRGTSDGSAGWTEQTLNSRPNHVTEQYDLAIKKKFEYGLTGGAGMEVNTSVGHFLLEGRYYYGLSDIFGNSKKDAFGKSSHGAIIGKVSYLFDIFKKK